MLKLITAAREFVRKVEAGEVKSISSYKAFKEGLEEIELLERGKLVRNCEECGVPFNVPPSAPHKRFHSEKCRRDFNWKRTKQALKALQDQRGAGAPSLDILEQPAPQEEAKA